MSRAWILTFVVLGCTKATAPQTPTMPATSSAPSTPSTPLSTATNCEDGRRYEYEEVENLLKTVNVGSTYADIQKQLGEPTMCSGGKVYYVGGLYTGPELTAELTLDAKGVVTHIERSGVACRFVRMPNEAQ